MNNIIDYTAAKQKLKYRKHIIIKQSNLINKAFDESEHFCSELKRLIDSYLLDACILQTALCAKEKNVSMKDFEQSKKELLAYTETIKKYITNAEKKAKKI